MKTGPQAYIVQPNVLGRIPDALDRTEEDVTLRNEPMVGEEHPEAQSQPTGTNLPPSYYIIKRAIDVTGALLGLIFLSPVFLLLAIWVRLDSPGSIIHRRRVLAKQKYSRREPPQTFNAYKFRTMIDNADDILKSDPNLMEQYQKEYKLVEDPRVTSVGAKIRPLSLDELPQLVNILRGQMSLVGPRMITPPELAMYGTDAARLLSVKPGLTGLWQVSGRTNVPYYERVRLDMYYIENRSILMDLQILWRTVGCVLARKGAV